MGWPEAFLDAFLFLPIVIIALGLALMWQRRD